MATNPNYEIKKQIDSEVMSQFEHNTVLRYFGTKKIGDGKQIWQRKFAEPPRIPNAQSEIDGLIPQALRTRNGKYRLPRLNLSISMKEDEYAERLSEGELPGHYAVLGGVMARAVDKLCYQGKALGTTEVQCKAMNDGAGTSLDDPIVCINGTKKGLWTTATFADGDFGTLIGPMLSKSKFEKGPKLLLAPAISAPAFMLREPGNTTGLYIMDTAKTQFSAIHWVPTDDPADPGVSALSLLTGEAETEADFELFCVNTSCWTWVYDTAPFTTLEHDILNKRWVYQMEVHGALIPSEIEDISGTKYKALTKIDDCNNT